MISIRRKSYQSHRNVSKNEILAEMQKDKLKIDRYYMLEMLKPNIDFLENLGITDLQNFIESFKKLGYKTDNIKDFIKDFQLFITTSNVKKNWQPINWMRERELTKANFGEKNIIINRLAIQYPEEFLTFSRNYTFHKCISTVSQENFIQEIDFKIKQLQNTIKNKSSPLPYEN